MESTLSRTPPCPGMIFPLSFTPALRLNNDSIKSPISPKISTKKAITIHCQRASPADWKYGIYERPTANPAVNTQLLRNPSHVLPGEIFGANLCLPNNDPKTYAAVSDIQIRMKKASTGTGCFGIQTRNNKHNGRTIHNGQIITHFRKKLRCVFCWKSGLLHNLKYSYAPTTMKKAASGTATHGVKTAATIKAT